MALVALNGLADAAWAGHLLGPEALAGLSLALPPLLLQQAVTGLVAGGAASAMSRALGRADGHTLARLPNLVLFLSLAFAAPLALGYPLAPRLIGWMGGSGEMLEWGCAYYRVQALGACFGIYAVSANSLVRALGHAGRAAGVTAAAVAANLVLTPLLVAGLDLGMAGLSLATVLSSALCALAATRSLKRALAGVPRMDAPVCRRASWVSLLRAVLRDGLPALALQGSGLLRQILLFQAVARHGSAWDLALFGAAFRLYSFALVPGFGILQAMQPVIGANHGAGREERALGAYRLFLAAGVLLSTLLAVPCMLLPDPALSLFLPEAVLTGPEERRVRWVMAALPLSALASAGLTYLQAAGRGKIAAGMILGRQIGLFLPLLYLLPSVCSDGLDGLYLALLVENLAAAALFAWIPWAVRRRPVSPPSSPSCTNTAEPGTGMATW
jgi:Na+-driven multidrug efflux pump